MTNEAEPFGRIDVATAREKLESHKAVAIDVRMPFDYAGGRIPGAVNFPNQSLRSRRATLPEDRELLIVSEDGTQSVEVCKLAVSLGLKDVSNVEGGMAAWTAAGYDLETISDGVFSSPG